MRFNIPPGSCSDAAAHQTASSPPLKVQGVSRMRVFTYATRITQQQLLTATLHSALVPKPADAMLSVSSRSRPSSR